MKTAGEFWSAERGQLESLIRVAAFALALLLALLFFKLMRFIGSLF